MQRKCSVCRCKPGGTCDEERKIIKKEAEDCAEEVLGMGGRKPRRLDDCHCSRVFNRSVQETVLRKAKPTAYKDWLNYYITKESTLSYQEKRMLSPHGAVLKHWGELGEEFCTRNYVCNSAPTLAVIPTMVVDAIKSSITRDSKSLVFTQLVFRAGTLAEGDLVTSWPLSALRGFISNAHTHLTKIAEYANNDQFGTASLPFIFCVHSARFLLAVDENTDSSRSEALECISDMTDVMVERSTTY